MEREPHRGGPRAAEVQPDRRRHATAARAAAAEARVTALAPAIGAGRARSAAAGAALAAAALVMATQLLDDTAWSLRVRALDASYEWSWSHFASIAAIALGAVLCTVGAVRAGAAGDGRRRAWRVAAVLMGVLFADNVTRLHEHVPHWPVFYAPIVAGLGVAVARVAAGRPAARLVYAAVGLLCLSLVIHVAGPKVVSALGWSPTSLAFQVKVALKEGSELAGWVLLLAGLSRLVPLSVKRKRARAAAGEPGPGYAA